MALLGFLELKITSSQKGNRRTKEENNNNKKQFIAKVIPIE